MNRKATELRIGGFARLSTCDWPGQLAATVFCQGCAWDCPYCHNPGLRPQQAENLISWRSIFEFLESRRGLLASGVPYEVRTKWHPVLLSLDDMLKLEEQLLDLGIENFALQKFRAYDALPDRLPQNYGGFVLPENYSDGFSHFEVRRVRSDVIGIF